MQAGVLFINKSENNNVQTRLFSNFGTHLFQPGGPVLKKQNDERSIVFGFVLKLPTAWFSTYIIYPYIYILYIVAVCCE